MISASPDPLNPDRVVLTATVTLYLNKLVLSTLSDEIEKAVRAQAVKDLKGSPAVRKAIQEAATRKLLSMLDVPKDPPVRLDPIRSVTEQGSDADRLNNSTRNL